MNQSFDQKKSYGQILKSTTLIGGSSLVAVLLKIIQTKAVAVLLGPAGVGLIGLYGSITGIVGQITNIGIRNSGVRQIAEAAGSGDDQRIAQTTITLRCVAIILGFVGMLVVLIFRNTICIITFGNTDHATALSIISVTLLFGAISGGQAALIQGLRRIEDLGKLNILGALFGTITSIPFIYFWDEFGIAFFMVTVSATGIMTSWWYARKISIVKIHMSLKEISKEAKALLRLGIVFMVSGIMGLGTLYFIGVIVVRQLGIDAAGLFQASSAIASVYVSFIMKAMGADFYPRLTAMANDDIACNQMVNEQVEVGLLIAIPGILATITFAPYIVQIFYSERFSPTINILRWEILGILLQVASWPMGFILPAKGRAKIYFYTELSSNLIYIGFVFVLLKYFGLPGTGMAFFGQNLLYCLIIFFVVQRLTGFSCSKANRRLILCIIPTVAIVFVVVTYFSTLFAAAIGTVVTLVAGTYCLKSLYNKVGPEKVKTFIAKLKIKFQLPTG
jgi:PST family polysaccharide transporter